MSFIRGRRYNRLKKTKAEAGATGGASNGQNDQCLTTAESLAKQYGVSEKTIRRDGADAALLDNHPEKAAAVIRGEVKKSAAVQELGGEVKPNKDAVKPVPECSEAIQFCL